MLCSDSLLNRKDCPQKILVCNLLVIFFVKEKPLNDIFVCFFFIIWKSSQTKHCGKKRFLLILCYAYFNVAWMVAWITGIFSFDIFFHNPGYYPVEQNVSNTRVILNHLLLISWLNDTLYLNLFYSVEVCLVEIVIEMFHEYWCGAVSLSLFLFTPWITSTYLSGGKSFSSNC